MTFDKELNESFAASQARAQITETQAASLVSQSKRFWTNLIDEMHSKLSSINSDSAMCKAARGPLRYEPGDPGHVFYRSLAPAFSVTLANHGTNLTIDWRRQEGMESQLRLFKSDRFLFELDGRGVLQIRSQNGQMFATESQVALHTIQPFWE